MSTGKYSDRRQAQGHAVDATKIIWILATNIADETIEEFYDKHQDVLENQLTADTNILRHLTATLTRKIEKKILVPKLGVSPSTPS
jgi:hypothetical protein